MSEAQRGTDRFRKAFLLLLVASISAAFLATIHAFLMALVLAAVFTGVCRPLYLGLLATASLVVGFDLAHGVSGPTPSSAVDAAFQVVSILTTTGFATADFAEWPGVSRATLVALMVSGGVPDPPPGGPRSCACWSAGRPRCARCG